MPIDDIYVKTQKFLASMFTRSNVIMDRIDAMVDVVKNEHFKDNAIATRFEGERWAAKIRVESVELNKDTRELAVDLRVPKDIHGDYMVLLQSTVNAGDIYMHLVASEALKKLEQDVKFALVQVFVDAAFQAAKVKETSAPKDDIEDDDELFNILNKLFGEEEQSVAKKPSGCHCPGCVEPCALDDDDDESGPEYDCICGEECGCEKAEPIIPLSECEPGEDSLVDRFCLDEDEYFVVEQNPCGKTVISIYQRNPIEEAE